MSVLLCRRPRPTAAASLSSFQQRRRIGLSLAALPVLAGLTLVGGSLGNPALAASSPVTNLIDLDTVVGGGVAFGEGVAFGKGGITYVTAGAGDGMILGLVPSAKPNGPWTGFPAWKFNSSTDGDQINYRLAVDKKGVLYGTMTFGGPGKCGCGVVFALAPKAGGGGLGTLTLLHVFGGHGDGSGPSAGPVFEGSEDTVLYGTTGGGGKGCPGGCGTVWKLKIGGARSLKTPLYAFKGGKSKDGQIPISALAFDKAGNIYGTTLQGGEGCVSAGQGPGCGTVFKLTKRGASYSESAIYRFKGGNDGAFPYGDLTVAPNGDIYGTTFGGDVKSDKGTVFRLRGKGTSYAEQVLWRFKGGSDGAGPLSGVHRTASGVLYGTTSSGANFKGAVYRIKPGGAGLWPESVIFRFKGGPKGAIPQADIVANAKGQLFSTAFGDVNGDDSIFFELKP